MSERKRNRSAERKAARMLDKEYWSRRPTSNRSGSTPGKETKRLTHRLERAAAKRELLTELSTTPPPQGEE